MKEISSAFFDAFPAVRLRSPVYSGLLKREREKLHEMTNHRQCYKPIPQLVEELNRHLKGWANYFSFGYPREAFREINSYVRYRLEQHLKRRSQRPFRPAEGVSMNDHFQKLGLVYL